MEENQVFVSCRKHTVGETGAQWIRNLLFQYITDPVRATGIFYITNDNTIDGLSNTDA